MSPALAGFDYHRIAVADGLTLNTAIGGSGSPIVLLHGFPQTHLMWRHVAADLAADHTVICPDLRGYGDSDKPADPDGQAYSKRTMAADIVTAARALGHHRFALVGHDRAPWSPSGRAWTTPTSSRTWPRWTSCPTSTPGTFCTASRRPSHGTCT